LARFASQACRGDGGARSRSRFRGPGAQAAVEAELGDLLFTVVNLGRHLGVDAEMALRGCNLRFRNRFREMEQEADRPLEELSPQELEALWVQAKRKLSVEPLPALKEQP